MADAKPASRRAQARAESERRWPVVVAVVVALLLYALLPSTFTPILRYAVVAVSAGILIALIFLNPARFVRQTRWSRILSGVQALVLVGANQIALVQVIIQLVQAHHSDGPALLLAALQVWVTNVIAFGVLYWEIDRGGPVARRRDEREELQWADFRFPQDENADNVEEVKAGSSIASDWMPGYFDYLYFSASNSMAFSPTDVMPLTSRAKALMLFESFAGFVILALVIARAVSLLG